MPLFDKIEFLSNEVGLCELLVLLLLADLAVLRCPEWK